MPSKLNHVQRASKKMSTRPFGHCQKRKVGPLDMLSPSLARMRPTCFRIIVLLSLTMEYVRSKLGEAVCRSIDCKGLCSLQNYAAASDECPKPRFPQIDQHIHLVRDLHQVVDILSIAKDVISTAEHGIIDGAMLAEPILTSLKPGVGSAVMQIIASIST